MEVIKIMCDHLIKDLTNPPYQGDDHVESNSDLQCMQTSTNAEFQSLFSSLLALSLSRLLKNISGTF
jgi:hypothetical protein